MKYVEKEEEEWEVEDEDIVVLSDEDEAEDNQEDEGILFDKHTVVSEVFVHVIGFVSY